MAIKKKPLTRTIYGKFECILNLFYEPQKFARLYIINSLYYDTILVAQGWEQAIQFSEILNAFLKNNFSNSRSYIQGQSGHICTFSLYLGDYIPKLRMRLILDESYNHEFDEPDEEIVVDFDKVEVTMIYGALSRIFNKCDLSDNFD